MLLYESLHPGANAKPGSQFKRRGKNVGLEMESSGCRGPLERRRTKGGPVAGTRRSYREWAEKRSVGTSRISNAGIKLLTQGGAWSGAKATPGMVCKKNCEKRRRTKTEKRGRGKVELGR